MRAAARQLGHLGGGRGHAWPSSGLSVRHVSDEIVAATAISRTVTGKKVELSVKKLMLGHAPDQVVKRDALAQPGAIDWFVNFAAAYQRRG